MRFRSAIMTALRCHSGMSSACSCTGWLVRRLLEGVLGMLVLLAARFFICHSSFQAGMSSFGALRDGSVDRRYFEPDDNNERG